MTLSEMLLSEFDEEAVNTRKILECLPSDRFDWKPHEKSFILGRLANHVSELALYATVLIRGQAKKPAAAESKIELLAQWDERVTAAREAIAGAADEFWGERVALNTPYEGPRVVLYRKRIMNHLIHHRGQLSVYLRLLDVPFPGMYGPSADDKPKNGS